MSSVAGISKSLFIIGLAVVIFGSSLLSTFVSNQLLGERQGLQGSQVVQEPQGLTSSTANIGDIKPKNTQTVQGSKADTGETYPKGTHAVQDPKVDTESQEPVGMSTNEDIAGLIRAPTYDGGSAPKQQGGYTIDYGVGTSTTTSDGKTSMVDNPAA